jgi:hypothetical protein
MRLGSTSADIGYAIKADAAGDVFVAGQIMGTVDLGDGPYTCAGSSDAFVAKYSSTGAPVWSVAFGGSDVDVASALAVDSAGDVIVTGYFSGTASFGGPALTSAGLYDVFLAKYSGADGSHLWSKRFGAAAEDLGYGVAFDGSDDVVLTGTFRNSVSFGGATLASAYGGYDIFVAKYDGAAGAHVWSKKFTNSGGDIGYGVAVDGANNVLLTGSFNGGVDFGGGTLASAGDHDVFVAKLSPAGAHVWSKRFGAPHFDRGWSIAADAAGGVVVAGSFMDGVDFGAGLLTSGGFEDSFLVKLAADGSHVWSKRFGATGSDYAYSVAVDEGGDVAVTGYFQSSVSFGGTALAASGTDMFVAKYSAAGAHRWSKRFGGSSVDYGYGVALDGAGNVLATGSFMGAMTLGGQSITSAGSTDALILELAP